MKKLQDFRIVFMGTPAFAVAILEKLVKEGCNVVAVITAPDKPAGRGMQLTESAVKKFAVEHGLHLLQPLKLKDPEFVSALADLKADVQVVVAFRMLPEIVWNMPLLGTINLHASLLPKYRGAAPINWAIINGEKETGLTTFRLQHAIDTGDVLMQQKVHIREDETAGELHDEMMALGAELVYTTLDQYCTGVLVPKPQAAIAVAEDLPTAPKIHTDTCKIDWNKTAQQVYDLVRGLSPYPGCFSFLDGKMMKVFKVSFETVSTGALPGEYHTDGKSYLRFAAVDGWVSIAELQLEGKRRMDIASFLRGHRFG
ncbi:MAG: methionyl-tRNA formyltransferase [Chitinophagaceae bacterium]|nr:methionyl-tRNA formyltransferase [Chitinophagaceae bacterium]